MSHPTRTPDAAKQLLEVGWIYLDVRTVEEFEAGHPEGAYNLPIMLRDAAGAMAPNSAFASALKRTFPLDARLVIGCRSGQRSAKACQVALGLGYREIVDVCGGFAGATDASGRVVQKGWQAHGLPCSTSALPGRSWRELRGG
jgi:rhodanese-related sulfurtransferase